MLAVLFGLASVSVRAQDPPLKPNADDPKRVGEEFAKVYRLEKTEVLKAIPDPDTTLRMLYYKDRPGLGVPQDSSNVHVYYRWRDEALSKNPFWMGGGETVQALPSPLLGLQSQAVEGDARLLRTKIKADFIVRDKAPAKDVVASLETVLRRDFGLPVKLTLADLERPCVVVRGRYKYTPAPGQPPREPGAMDRIEVRVSEIGNDPNMDLNAAGGFSQVLSLISGHTGYRFIDEVEKAPDKILELHITAYSNALGVSDERLEGILKNLTNETGLTYERVMRKVPVLTVERTD